MIAADLGFPVVLKIYSPQITHKTDVGGVALNLGNGDEVRSAFEQIVAKVHEKSPEATIEGVTVQPMISRDPSVELIVGAKQDPAFGAVILAGAGGIAAEVFRDRGLGLPPLNERLARRMLESLQSWPLLAGYRGRAGVDVERLVEVLIRFSYLIADHPEITEFDINPLLASPTGVIAVDARAVIDRGRLQIATPAICPSGDSAVSRPVRPAGDAQEWPRNPTAADSPRRRADVA